MPCASGLCGIAGQVPFVQSSLVHGFLSSQDTPFPTHTPCEHMVFAAHVPESEHAVPLSASCKQPCVGSQLSFVQSLLSSQLSAVPPPHVTFMPSVTQCSPVVHASPSEQVALALNVCVQPLFASQASSVHGLLSSQLLHRAPGLPAVEQAVSVVPFWQAPLASTQPAQQTPRLQRPALQPV